MAWPNFPVPWVMIKMYFYDANKVDVGPIVIDIIIISVINNTNSNMK